MTAVGMYNGGREGGLVGAAGRTVLGVRNGRGRRLRLDRRRGDNGSHFFLHVFLTLQTRE